MVSSKINEYPRGAQGGIRTLTNGEESETNSLDISRLDDPRRVETGSMHAVSEQLETSKLLDKQVGSWSIKGSLVNNGRCPKCTLKPPCKHYDKIDDLPEVIEKQSPRLKALPPLPPPTNKENNVIPQLIAN